MTNRRGEFRVHESTLLLMLKGMTVEQLRAAVKAPVHPLKLVNGDNTTTVGNTLFDDYKHHCSDYKEQTK